MSISSERQDARAPERLVWGLGLLFFSVLAGYVWLGLPIYVAATALPAQLPLRGLAGAAAVLLWLGGLAGVGALAWKALQRLGAERLADKRAFWWGLAVLLAFRLAAVVAFDAPLVSDFIEYRDLAVAVTHGGSWFSELRPMGYPWMLAGLYALFGVQGWLAEGLNLVFAATTGLLLHRFTARAWGPLAANAALWLYALAPAQVLMAAVPGTEVAYGALLTAALEAATLGGGWVAIAAFLLAGSQYVRPTSLALLPPMLAAPLLKARPRRAIAWTIGALVAFCLVLTPVGLWNQARTGHFSISTSQYGGWSLLVGTNPRHFGMWNQEDAELVAKLPTLPERDARAKELAISRLKADPLAFVGLSFRKFAVMWAIEDYGAFWTMGTAPVVPRVPYGIWVGLSQFFYALLLGLALIGLWLERHRRPLAAVLIIAITITVAAMHALLEVQPRYHAYLVPLFCVLAGVGIARLLSQKTASEEQETEKAYDLAS